MTTRGRFISLEGIDGAGKSTHAAWLKDAIAASGRTVVTTREPGGTPLGTIRKRCSCSRRGESTSNR